ncbi:hypothetical protein D9756_010658 [Leucocoprinus leucothites]|uniref:CCHC-type domain-containing protein n=1 Tax=Leucocoprinus leucothites TaxID=201217 RepID=A0A8H5CTE2_9AGAR|nr:hypothetical protein D9756_010658 [Leucoagaricus leucothites]
MQDLLTALLSDPTSPKDLTTMSDLKQFKLTPKPSHSGKLPQDRHTKLSKNRGDTALEILIQDLQTDQERPKRIVDNTDPNHDIMTSIVNPYLDPDNLIEDDQEADDRGIYKLGTEDDDNPEEEESEGEDINQTYNEGPSNTDRDVYGSLYSHIINNVLTDKQRIALKRGECFFCHKKGHFTKSCPARKVWFKSRGKTNMGLKQMQKSQSKPKQGNCRPFKPKKKDPDAMVYKIDQASDEDDPFQEYSNENF